MKKLLWITLFSVSMGFLESAIVIYLRALYYPEGFDFPLKAMPGYLIATELIREAATIFILAGIAWLAAQSKSARLAWFLYCFAIWDIFYYVFLKLLLNWPLQWLTWDVLFLIPCLWVGPVLAPVILSLLMIAVAYFILKFENVKGCEMNGYEYALLISGACIHVLNFCWENLMYMIHSGDQADLQVLHLNYIPSYFNWRIFAMGCLPILGAIFSIARRMRIRKNALQLDQFI